MTGAKAIPRTSIKAIFTLSGTVRPLSTGNAASNPPIREIKTKKA
jgi:hypothetical protein